MKKRSKADVRAAVEADRIPSDRTINKQDAARHMLHAAIRLMFMQEDPFLVHMAAQSCDKLLIDLAKHKGIDDLDINRILVKERADEFWHIYRETYNYFKHADYDADIKLNVYDIVALNEMQICMNIGRATQLGLRYDRHMHFYMTYMLSYYPNVERLINIEVFNLPEGARNYYNDRTRGEMMDMLHTMSAADRDFIDERETDLAHVREAGLKNLRASG